MRDHKSAGRINCDNASGKHIPFGCAGIVCGFFAPCRGDIAPRFIM